MELKSHYNSGHLDWYRNGSVFNVLSKFIEMPSVILFSLDVAGFVMYSKEYLKIIGILACGRTRFKCLFQQVSCKYLSYQHVMNSFSIEFMHFLLPVTAWLNPKRSSGEHCKCVLTHDTHSRAGLGMNESCPKSTGHMVFSMVLGVFYGTRREWWGI